MTDLEVIIKNLKNALEVVQSVDYSADANAEYTAPYAIGYARSAIDTSIKDLEFFIKTNPQ
jgi:hypothetical protein